MTHRRVLFLQIAWRLLVLAVVLVGVGVFTYKNNANVHTESVTVPLVAAWFVFGSLWVYAILISKKRAHEDVKAERDRLPK